MHAFADGATIEQRDPRIVLASMPPQPDRWRDFNGRWQDEMEYRVKPEPPAKLYPVTGMRNGDLCSAYFNGGNVSRHEEVAAYRRIANAALRHAIDAHQVVTTAEHQAGLDRLAHNLRDVAIDRDKMRDLAIAETARALCLEQIRDTAVRRAVMDIQFADFRVDGK